MGEVEYTNLRLTFKHRGDRDYEVTAAIDGGATTTSTFTIPMSDDALQEAIRDLSETRSAVTGSTTRKITPVTAPGVTAQQFGTTLANALFTGDIATMFDDARGKGCRAGAAQHDHRARAASHPVGVPPPQRKGPG
jgi:hypothetical protein